MTKNTNVHLTDAERKARLQELLNKLESGARVTNRHLQLLLTADEFEKFEADWERTRKPIMRGSMPSTLKRYAAMLRRPDVLSGRKDCSGTLDRWQLFKAGPNCNGKYRGIESDYARALEYLEEAMGDEPGLAVWLDRYVDFNGHDYTWPTPDPAGVPRLITSQSDYAQTRKYSNRCALKRIALQDSLAECIFDDEKEQSAGSDCKSRKFARGISDVPVDPNATAERIFGDGKWQVI